MHGIYLPGPQRNQGQNGSNLEEFGCCKVVVSVQFVCQIGIYITIHNLYIYIYKYSRGFMVDMALVAGIIQLAPSQGQDLLDGNPGQS